MEEVLGSWSGFWGSVVSERREDVEGEETRDWLRNEEPQSPSLYTLQADRCSGTKNNYHKGYKLTSSYMRAILLATES